MKKYFFMIMILFILCISTQASAEEEKERVIVTFDESINERLLEDPTIEVHHIFDDLTAVSISVSSEKKEELLQDPSIKRIERDPVIKTSEQINNTGYSQVLADKAYSNGWTGKGVKIGIIDTGIKQNHPDLKVAGGISFVEGTTSYDDDEGHGTHVAGIIGAQNNTIGTVGVAPEAEIYAIKAIDSTGYGNLSDVIAGIQWAMEQNLDIVNLSLTSTQGTFILEEMLNQAYKNGLLIIAAAGNAKSVPAGVDVLYPARYASVIAVGSVNAVNQRSYFSYYGKSLELVAPGEAIYSTYNGESGYDYVQMNGTSMASPFVAGVAALYKQANPGLTNEEIRAQLQQNAFDLGITGRDDTFGYGLVQAPSFEKEDQPVQLFSDIPTEKWYAEEIEYLFNREIITGYEDGGFYPNNPVTRAEAITMIGRALELNGERTVTKYKDVVKNYYASGYIQSASNLGIIQGFPNSIFSPKAAVIRGDVAVMIQKAFHYESTVVSGFSDVKSSKYYYEPIHALITNHITTGYPDQTFRPTLKITRAEFAVFLARALDETFRE